jgi:hypothetical protein
MALEREIKETEELERRIQNIENLQKGGRKWGA